MPVPDPSTPIGKVRYRIGDIGQIPILDDAVIQGALDDANGNIPRASSQSAQYILATLSFKTHRKLQGLETWGDQQFANYLKFLNATILNPNLMSVAPIPYDNTGEENPLMKFVEDWNKAYSCGCIGFVT
jgi:hypothetical protein